MKEILEIGGAGFLIPAVLFLLLLYAVKGLYGVVGHRSRHRKEFLELWDPVRAQDDLWLEVVVRHHFGTTLPAGIIRLAFAQSDKSLALFELCELWPLFRYDRDARNVAWRIRWHATAGKRRIERTVMLILYFLFSLTAFVYAWVVPAYGPNSAVGWISGIGSLCFFGFAYLALVRCETLSVAITFGDEWLNRINDLAAPTKSNARHEVQG